MERALRQTPGPYPGGAAWSKLGLLAIGLEKAVVIVSPNDLEHGDAGHVVLGDDTSSGAGDLGSVFPACIVGNARTPGAIHCRPLLRRGSRPEVTARCVAWSPVFDEPNNKHTRPPRCALVVVSTSHAVSVHAQSTLGTTSEWLDVCDLAKLEREALETETENESAPNAFAKGPAPAPRAPVDLSNAVVSVLTRASAAARPAPALPPTPATAARALIRRQLPVPTPTPKPQKPPPSNALAPGVRAKTRRGSTTGSWRPGTVTFVISEYVFRVKVRYDDDDEFDNNDNNDKNELKETWLAWDEAPPVFVELGENGDPLAFAATCSSAFEFPPSTSSSGHWLCLGSPRPANTTGEAVAKTSSYAVHDQTCKTDKNGFVPAKPETEEALVRLGSVSDADLDDAPTATKKKTLAPAKAKAKKPPVAKIPPVDLAAPLAADGLAKTGTYENAIAACAAARVAVANKQTVLRFVETTAPSGTLGLDAAVALATDAVFATAPPSLELVTQAFDVLAKKTQNFAISKLALRVADAFMAARYGLGIDTTYAKGKHVVGDDKACLSKTFESAFLKILKIGKQGKQGGAEAKQTELTKSELKKVCFKQARELVNVTAETKETTDCGTNRATTRGGKAPTNAIALSSDSDEDGLPRVLDSDAEFVVKPAASQTPRFPAPRKRKQPDSQTLFATGTAVCASKNIRLANRLAALCVAWSDSSLVAVGAKSGHVVVWRAVATAGAGCARVGITAHRLGATRVANAWVTSLAWADHSSRIVIGASDGSVRVWDVSVANSGPSVSSVRGRKETAKETAAPRPPLSFLRQICPPDGVPVTLIAVDVNTAPADARLVAFGKASGAVVVCGLDEPSEVPWQRRLFVTPVGGLAWCASPVASKDANASRLFCTTRGETAAVLDVVSQSTRGFAVREAPLTSLAAAETSLAGAAQPDGLDVPVDFFGPIASSPNGTYVARVLSYHRTETLPQRGGDDTGGGVGRLIIAARMRRGAIVVEQALCFSKRLSDEEVTAGLGVHAPRGVSRTLALEAAVFRVVSARSLSTLSAQTTVSLWDLRHAAEALGGAGIDAALRGANRALTAATGDAKKRAEELVGALTAGLRVDSVDVVGADDTVIGLKSVMI